MDTGPIINLFNQLLTAGAAIAAATCAFFVMLAGYQYMTAGGSVRVIESAKGSLYNALIGFAIVILCRVIANLVGGALLPHPGHSCRCFSSGQLELSTRGDLGLQPFVEPHTFLPLVGMRHVGVVGSDETLNLLGRYGGIGKVGSLEALAAEDREPDLDKTEPRGMHWQEVEDKPPLRMAVQPVCHFGGPVGADRIEDQMDGRAWRSLLVEQGQQFAELA